MPKRGERAPNVCKGKQFPPEILTPAEVRRLIRACSSRAPTGIRNAALIAALYRGGLRVSEALDLHVKDFDPETAVLRVLNGKGGRSRTVALDDAALTLIERWLDQRKGLGLNGRPVLFSSLKGTRLAANYVRQLLPRLAQRAGIEKRVHAHGLRHSFAAGLMAEGVPVNVISKALGHTSIATTAVYLGHIQPQQVIDTLRARTWNL